MRKLLGILCLGLVFGFLISSVDVFASQSLSRKDCFFGLHFDLHPNEHDTELGKDTTEENVAALLERVKPDYVQYDCKGHRGYCGYPSEVGSPSPGIVKDALAIWRKATRDRGVGLFVHFSGVWDNQALELHPEWARIDANGKADEKKNSTFGPYVDELLIPQLHEVVSKYGLDGVWVDGECWGAELDYCPAALKAWKEKTGLDEAPKKAGEAHWQEWKNFQRDQFEAYLSHWVNELHRLDPGVQITSNWMYTSFAPKPVVAPLDFLSGDYSPGESVNKARYEARYLASTGMPWDLMAWGFDKGGDQIWSWKTPIHLMQEASVVLMQGGGFQIYYQPTRAGFVPQPIIDTTGKVADFCRARQEVSHKSTSVPQVALLLSNESYNDRSNRVFSPWGGEYNNLQGALQALLEMQYTVDVLAEHQLKPKLDEYPLVVLPDTHKLPDEFKSALLAYVRKGGSLLLLDLESAKLFYNELGVSFEGEPKQVRAELASGTGIVNANGVWQNVKLNNAKAVGYRYLTRDSRRPGEEAATVVGFGDGKIGAVYGPFCKAYLNTHHPQLREFLKPMMAELFPNPAVKVEGPSCLDVSLRKTQDGRLSLHLMNCANMPMGNYRVIDCIPVAGPIEVTMQVTKKPKRVKLIPSGDKLKWKYKKGVLNVEIPKVHIHEVMVVE